MFNLFSNKIKKYEYGCRANKSGVYRRCVKTGEVQFILWKKGEQGHKHDYWYRMASCYWNEFEPYKE
ncbi:MAG TPA: hypothetical protein DDW91_17680 [Shewanella frigidimarina]|nr:hypothetical protein [Shewanella frigidimarina]